MLRQALFGDSKGTPGPADSVFAVVFDGIIDGALVQIAERSSIKHLIAMDSKVRNTETRINILTSAEL